LAALAKDAIPVPISKENPNGLQFSQAAQQQINKLPTNDPPKSDVDGYLKEAEKNRAESGNLYEQPPLGRGREVLGYGGRVKAAEAEAAAKAQEEQKNNGEMSKFLHNAGNISNHLKADIKFAKELIDSPDMTFGPFAKDETAIQSMKLEFADLMDRMGYTDIAKKARSAGWNPAPNQIYTKLMSGLVLQNLRNFLGPQSGQFRVFELQLLEKAMGNDNISKEGNKAVLEIIDRMNDRASLINKMAYAYEKKHHLIDASFMGAVEKMQEEHPQYTTADIAKVLNNPANTTTPGSQPAPGGPIGTPPPSGAPSGIPSREDLLRRKEQLGK
jgi:hypothetical protein